ncbi:MAG: AAA family ATPase [Candidatus Eremiobacteraeota bacterium]|nr:AAA family ATPase [Candidatus Eremiobacteraeota bacterium]
MSSLILEHFQFSREPFGPQIGTTSLYQFTSFKQGRLRLEEALNRGGMLLVVGEPGSGKSAMLRSFCDKLATSSHEILYTCVPMVTNPARAVIESLLGQAGERIPFNNVGRGVALLRETFQRLHERGKLPVVLIDDAHHLNPDGWLLFKSLTNYDMDSRKPLLLIFVGTRAELLTTFSWTRLSEVRGRLLFCYHLRGLEEKEIGPYLKAHLAWAGCDRPLFPKEVALEIHRHANGLPRAINRLAHSCLVASACDRGELVGLECLERALSEHLFATVPGGVE